ncbi:P-loop containing nucleoside triphosphate hydrolase protein [Pholiota conissans]|uniref:P-loop containing nucleoside triphosphate hydrolase protein n=1 Tax=Pholiota conissans TaxID=109636 RepID=A0A9P5YWX4_9AGAR|nr:P-loop containing nucleoside triphosphate hydrolase protein [Pholiota conissans]
MGHDEPPPQSAQDASTLQMPQKSTSGTTVNGVEMPPTRGYQQEMLDESLKRNIIIALDTGSGKTLIAVLRMKHEMEREPTKLSWFFAPTVALCDQQKAVIEKYLPVSVGIVSGANEPDQWKNATLWQRVLSTHRIVVSTPQVFLDALRHGYISLGRDVSLLVFDEAHHAVDNHPYNRIMIEFYQPLPPRTATVKRGNVRPMVLGLTASPIYGGNVEKAFKTIETNLDCTIRAPRKNRAELATYVHPPVFKHVMHKPSEGVLFSTNLASLTANINKLDIENDPYVKSLRSSLKRSTPGSPEYIRTDQKLSKVIAKQNSFTHKGMADFYRAAYDICADIGPWAADWFVWKVLDRAKTAANPYNTMMMTWRSSEKAYLLSIINKIVVSDVSYYADDIVDDLSDKTRVLIECLLEEQAEAEALGEAYSCIVFVQRRDAVLALAEVLKHHPKTKDAFSIGTLLGSSDSLHRHAMMDITRSLVREASQDAVLAEFKSGAKNLIISTAVAEEGIDIQACGSVIRWDLPPNMASWAQSKGRARKRRSTFTMMFEEGSGREEVNKWVGLEKQMREAYNDSSRDKNQQIENNYVLEDEEEEEELEFRIESTGACLTLHSAISHLTHFCAVIPNSTHVDNRPLFELDPPEFPEGWHFAQSARPDYSGPYGSTVTLPRTLPIPLAERTFTVPRTYRSRISAHRHSAFLAYRSLYERGLLNDSLLPITSIVQPHLEKEVRSLLAEVEKREGLAEVLMGMDPWAAPEIQDGKSDTVTWHAAVVLIDGMAPLWLFTQASAIALEGTEGPLLYRSGVPPTQTSVRYVGAFEEKDLESRLEDAKEWTRMLFWGLNRSRMEWDNLDFSYFFLPTSSSEALSSGFDDVYSTTINPEWTRRRLWFEELTTTAPDQRKYHLTARASEFGDAFGHPSDVTLVQRHPGYGRPFKFVRWQFEPLSPEEEEALQEMYRKKGDDSDKAPVEIQYPLLVAQAFPPRSNFLIPIPTKEPVEVEEENNGPPLVYLLSQYSGILLFSQEETEYAFLLPSILRFLSMRMTAFSLHKDVFSNPESCLSSPAPSPVPPIPLPLLTTAITAPVSGEQFNYQRMETLGDTVLKFIAGLNIFAEHPLWHEGYLTQKKDHAVSNVRLAKENVRLRLYHWIIRDTMLGKKWKPKYVAFKQIKSPSPPPPEPDVLTTPPVPLTDDKSSPPLPLSQPDGREITTNSTAVIVSASMPSVDGAEPPKKPKKKKRAKKSEKLSTKVLADVIESIVGAAYLHGSFSLGFEYLRFFGLGLKWESVPDRITEVIARVDAISVDEFIAPPQLRDVERMIGYTFKRKLLLIEALTHASYQGDERTPSYERMEFLGDSVLDMVVTDYLYRAPGKNYSPGHMHLRKSAMVNAHILGYFCLKTYTTVESVVPRPAVGGDGDDERRKGPPIIEEHKEKKKIHLWKCLLHSSPKVLEDQLNTATRFTKWNAEIEERLMSGPVFPWAALTRLQAPKLFSDMIESILGAVFLDSEGSFAVIRDVLRTLGILPLLERVVSDDVDVLHPVSRLSMWAAKNEKQVQYKVRRSAGRVACAVLVDGVEEAKEEVVWRGKPSQEEVRYNVAESAIVKFRLRDVGVGYEEIRKRKTKRKKGKYVDEDV